MEWNQETVGKLGSVFKDKYISMFPGYGPNFDRKNRSALWNKYLKNYEIKIIRNDVPGKPAARIVSLKYEVVVNNLIDLINFKNDVVANALMIPNPDRIGQFILINKDIAERVLVFGMI